MPTFSLPDPLTNEYPWEQQREETRRNFEAVQSGMEQALQGIRGQATVTSLPTTNLYDGREVYYVADATNGVTWHLKYKSSEATYKWHYVGGQALYAAVETSQTKTANSYGNLATTGPSITLPLAGDYRLEYGSNIEGATVDRHYATIKLGASAAGDDESISVAIGNPGGQSQGGDVSRILNITGRTAGEAMLMQYRTTLSSTATFVKRFITVLPVRVI